MGTAIEGARGLDLNIASEEELEGVGGLDQEHARRIVQRRPFRSWDDLKQVEGFSEALVEDLRSAGAQLG